MSPMNQLEAEAAVHLRTIRALMERATVYRAISAPAALAAGVLTLGVCGWLALRGAEARPSAAAFLGIWLVVLAVVSALNLTMLRRGAAARDEPFLSPGMKHALRAIAPPMGAGFAMSAAVAPGGSYLLIVSLWMTGYGLALLATGSFAPRSISVLGLCFTAAGLLCFAQGAAGPPPQESYLPAVVAMAATFGIFHAVYALAVGLSGRRQPVAPAAPRTDGLAHD